MQLSLSVCLTLMSALTFRSVLAVEAGEGWNQALLARDAPADADIAFLEARDAHAAYLERARVSLLLYTASRNKPSPSLADRPTTARPAHALHLRLPRDPLHPRRPRRVPLEPLPGPVPQRRHLLRPAPDPAASGAAARWRWRRSVVARSGPLSEGWLSTVG